MLSGAVVAVLLLTVVGLSFWLASTTGTTFEITLAIVVIVIVFAAIAGYFTAASSSIIGFATRWRADLELLFPPPEDEDDLLRDTRWTRNTFLWVAIVGVAAMFIYALQWKAAGFAQVFGSALMIALAALGGGIFFGFLFSIPRTLQEDMRAVPTAAAPAAAGGTVPTSAPAVPVASSTFGVNTNLEQISDWLTKIIVGLGLINLDKLPGKVRSFIGQLAPTVGGQYGFAFAIVATYALCGFMLGYLLTRLYLARAFALAIVRSTQVANATAGIRREIDRVGAQTAANVTVGAGSAEVDPISTEERVAAVRVERLAKKTDSEHLWEQVETLAHEYEAVRKAMSPGPARTKAMEVVATKLRTLGRACYELLPSLVLSLSPGLRLAAISFLEAQPSNVYLKWLGGRFSIETPFLLYHAAWALRHAGQKLDITDLAAVEQAIDDAIATMESHPAPDRNALETLKNAKREVAKRRALG